MSNFNDTLNRMKQLYTYGKELNESKEMNTHSIEYHAIAADGKSYGIIRENSKYYIKSAPKAKELIPEAYEYLGGFCNKSNYEYSSYNNALKNFELKMASINEACEGNVNISTLDPFKKGEFLVEATDAMKNEIARQRQIMYNAAMLMNESTEISRKDDVVKYDGKQPEAKTGKRGDEDLKDINPKMDYAGSKVSLQKKAEPFKENPVNEACDAAGCDCEKKDWGSVGLGKGKDPKTIGWDMEGQKTVNEEDEREWDEGLPASAGIGVADTDHNNDPFKNTVNEEEGLDLDKEPEEGEPEDLEGGEDIELGDEETPEDPEAEEVPEDLEGEELPEEEPEVEDVPEGPEDEELPEEEPENDLEDEELPEEEPEDFEIDVDEPEDDDTFDIDSDEEEIEDEDVPEDFEGEDFESDEELPEEEPEDFEGDEYPEEEPEEGLNEGRKRSIMNSIVESVTNKILKENELNVFGKHPGYRKKPMELPTTGEDKTQWGEDWNDESVYSEEPFGSKIGDGDPFNQLVNSVTRKVVEKLSEGKKKVR